MENSLFFIFSAAALIAAGNSQNHGYPATEGQFQYMASIWLQGLRQCSGAIISVSHVLTAGHCITGQKIIDFRVLVGGIAVTPSTTWHEVSKAHLHSGYEPVFIGGKPTHAKNDIGVLELKNPLVFGNTIQSIPLSIDSVSSPKLRCKFVWYRSVPTNSIHKVDQSLWWENVVTTTHADCNKLYPNIEANIRCILNPSSTRSPSPGDSGAPVVCDGKLTAILNSGFTTMDYAAKVLTIAPYRNWILEIIDLS